MVSDNPNIAIPPRLVRPTAALPCAFCGAIGPRLMREVDRFRLKCEGCGACGPSGKTESGAATAWNMRPAAGQVEWIAMEGQWPPIGVEVLACGVGKELGGIHVNQLEKGSNLGSGYDPELYYWAGGEDFDEVTHWAPLPAIPSALEVEGEA